MLAPTSDHKVKMFFVCNHKFHKPPHPTSKAHSFLTAHRRSKQNLSIPEDMHEHLCTQLRLHKIFIPWIRIRNNKMKTQTHPASSILELFQVHKHEISASYIRLFAPSHHDPPAKYQSPPNYKKTQKTFGYLSLPNCFSTEDSLYYINIKGQLIFSTPGKRSRAAELGLWRVNHYTIGTHPSELTCNIICIKSNSCSITLLLSHSLEARQHNFALQLYTHFLEKHQFPFY